MKPKPKFNWGQNLDQAYSFSVSDFCSVKNIKQTDDKTYEPLGAILRLQRDDYRVKNEDIDLDLDLFKKNGLMSDDFDITLYYGQFSNYEKNLDIMIRILHGHNLSVDKYYDMMTGLCPLNFSDSMTFNRVISDVVTDLNINFPYHLIVFGTPTNLFGTQGHNILYKENDKNTLLIVKTGKKDKIVINDSIISKYKDIFDRIIVSDEIMAKDFELKTKIGQYFFKFWFRININININFKIDQVLYTGFGPNVPVGMLMLFAHDGYLYVLLKKSQDKYTLPFGIPTEVISRNQDWNNNMLHTFNINNSSSNFNILLCCDISDIKSYAKGYKLIPFDNWNVYPEENKLKLGRVFDYLINDATMLIVNTIYKLMYHIEIQKPKNDEQKKIFGLCVSVYKKLYENT